MNAFSIRRASDVPILRIGFLPATYRYLVEHAGIGAGAGEGAHLLGQVGELVAAMLTAQLEHAAVIQERRGSLWRRYNAALPDWAARQDVVLPGGSRSSRWKSTEPR
mgnify:CR=1 FL=1